MFQAKRFYFLALLPLAFATEPKLELLEKSSEYDLELKVVFPGFEDTIVLNRYYLNENEKLDRVEKCRFIGNLVSNPKSSVALTGCIGKQDALITILSQNPDIHTMLNWKINGEVEDLQEDFYNMIREDVEEDEPDAEEEWDMVPEAVIDKKHCALELGGNITGLIPPELTLEVTVSYEDNFLAAYGGNHEEALAVIEATLTHAQAAFYDESLQTRINLKV